MPVGSNTAAEEKLWHKMWKVQVPSKLKLFLWQLAQQSLPTGDVRHHRNDILKVLLNLLGSRLMEAFFD
jgi:hypothetical protein